MTVQDISSGKDALAVKELTVKAETPVYGGYVMARDGKIMFIKGAIPGETVEVIVNDKKKDYSIASVARIIEPSPFRRRPRCSLFGECGGCQMQYMDYGKQVSVKEEVLVDAMKRIGGLDVPLMPPITGKEFNYRHRGQFKVSKGGEIGFYREGTRDVIPVEECPVMTDEINSALHKIRGMDIKGAKEIHIISGDTVALLVKGSLPEDSVQKMHEIGISGIAFDSGDSVGKDYITLDINSMKYSVTPWSFFQSHWTLNRVVIDVVIDKLTPLGDKRILDLYSGAGNFSIPLSVLSKEVVAVEENPNAVEDGKRNLMINGIKNCTFINSPVERLFGNKKMQKNAKLFNDSAYDIIILDPPRAGLTPECIRRIMETNSRKIVYVSCNPATLARDMKKMAERYEIESLRMIDFFPNTYHIEALAFLDLKGL